MSHVLSSSSDSLGTVQTVAYCFHLVSGVLTLSPCHFSVFPVFTCNIEKAGRTGRGTRLMCRVLPFWVHVILNGQCSTCASRFRIHVFM